MITKSMFRIPELTLQTLEACDIPAVAAFSMVNNMFAEMCEMHMQGRVQRLMMVLLGGDGELETHRMRHIAYKRTVVLGQDFMAALGKDNGVIVGSFVQALLKTDDGRDWEPQDLNVIVPNGRGLEMKSTLEAHGYNKTAGVVRFHMINSCVAHEIFKKDGKARITITEALTGNVLPSLFSCGNTATMNALTPRTLYSFYPSLTLQGKALTGPHWTDTYKERADRYVKQEISASVCTEGWKTPCGYAACPAVARRMEGLRSIGVMVWNRNGVEEKDLTEWSMSWGINRVCRNVNCESFGWRAWDARL